MSELDRDRQRQRREGRSAPAAELLGRTPAEWTSLIVSVVALAAVLGPLIYLYISGNVQPPIIEVAPQLDRVEHRDEFYYLPVQITNVGTRTASDVWVRIRHESPAGEQETVQFQTGFLAGSASTDAVVVFRQDPREGELEYTATFLTP